MAVIDEMRAADPASFAWKPPPYEYEPDKQPIDVIAGSPSFRAAIDAGERAEADRGAMAVERRGVSRRCSGRSCSTTSECLPDRPLSVERTIIVQAPAGRVLAAFFDPDDLAEWWQASCGRSPCHGRSGIYAVEWARHGLRRRDPRPARRRVPRHGHGVPPRPRILRRRGVLESAGGRPDRADGARGALHRQSDTLRARNLTCRQSGEDEGPRWQRYFQIVGAGWQRALADLKSYLENETSRSQR